MLVYGMAKSHLTLKPGQARSLELDLLRLIWAVECARREGKKAVGYLGVVDSKVETRAEVWRRKYRADQTRIFIVHLALTAAEEKKLRDEKERNAKGMKEERSIGPKTPVHDSVASAGKSIEKKLKAYIKRQHPGIRSTNKKLLSVNWDYEGEVSSSS